MNLEHDAGCILHLFSLGLESMVHFDMLLTEIDLLSLTSDTLKACLQ